MSSTNALRSPVNFGLGPLRTLAGGDALVLDGRQAAGEDGLADQRHRHAEVGSGDDRPLAGALLAGGVEDHVHHRLAGLVVLLGQDVSR